MSFQIIPNMQGTYMGIGYRKTVTLWPKNIVRNIS
jgi:hypothetical protein